MATFANLDSAEDHLEASGIAPEQIARLTEQARDALIFTRRVLPDAEVPLGTSKLGGAPDLPEGMAWPTRASYPNAPEMIDQLAQAYGPAGYVPNADLLAFFKAHLGAPAPLAFLAQFDLSTLAQTGPFDAGLAPVGRLLVFVDPAPFATGASPWDDGWIQVIHDTSGGPIARVSPPEQLLQLMQAHDTAQGALSYTPFDPTQCERLSPHGAVTLPMPRNFEPIDVYDALVEGHKADFTHLMGGYALEGEQMFSDQLGGHPMPIQNSVEADLLDVARPLLRPVTEAERAGQWDPDRWGHLLSIGGESFLHPFPATWGDGDLYIGHRPDPALPEALGQVWAISQQT